MHYTEGHKRNDTKFQLRAEHDIYDEDFEKTDDIIRRVMDIFRSENLTLNEAEYILEVCRSDLRHEARLGINTDAE